MFHSNMSRSNSLPNFGTHKTGSLKSLKKFISRRNSFSASHMSSKKEPSELVSSTSVIKVNFQKNKQYLFCRFKPDASLCVGLIGCCRRSV